MYPETFSSSLVGWYSSKATSPSCISYLESVMQPRTDKAREAWNIWTRKHKHMLAFTSMFAFVPLEATWERRLQSGLKMYLLPWTSLFLCGHTNMKEKSSQFLAFGFAVMSKSIVKRSTREGSATLNKRENPSLGWKAYELCSLTASFVLGILAFIMYTYPLYTYLSFS